MKSAFGVDHEISKAGKKFNEDQKANRDKGYKQQKQIMYPALAAGTVGAFGAASQSGKAVGALAQKTSQHDEPFRTAAKKVKRVKAGKHALKAGAYGAAGTGAFLAGAAGTRKMWDKNRQTHKELAKNHNPFEL